MITEEDEEMIFLRESNQETKLKAWCDLLNQIFIRFIIYLDIMASRSSGNVFFLSRIACLLKSIEYCLYAIYLTKLPPMNFMIFLGNMGRSDKYAKA